MPIEDDYVIQFEYMEYIWIYGICQSQILTNVRFFAIRAEALVAKRQLANNGSDGC